MWVGQYRKWLWVGQYRKCLWNYSHLHLSLAWWLSGQKTGNYSWGGTSERCWGCSRIFGFIKMYRKCSHGMLSLSVCHILFFINMFFSVNAEHLLFIFVLIIFNFIFLDLKCTGCIFIFIFINTCLCQSKNNIGEFTVTRPSLIFTPY